jgi:DNA-binding NarL/FixJ family response regulator
MVKIRVLLADDHPALRIGLRVLLDVSPDIEVVAEVDDGLAVMDQMQLLHPDVAVLDCQLPAMDGVAAAEYICKQFPATRVLALSAYDDDRYLSGMMTAGAVGYLLKSEAPNQIVEAVVRVYRGEELWSDEQYTRIERWRNEIGKIRNSLTEREIEVLVLIASGLSNKEIAQKLIITVRTADFHVSNILRKLGAVSRVEAAVWAQTYL